MKKMIGEKKDMICQSCGMPMNDKADHGTTTEGGYHDEYCKYCFQNGRFVDEGITMKEKIEKNISIAVSMGMDERKATDLAHSTIPRLKRWKKSD